MGKIQRIKIFFLYLFLTSKVLPLENTSKNENSFLFAWYFAHLIVPLSPDLQNT